MHTAIVDEPDAPLFTKVSPINPLEISRFVLTEEIKKNENSTTKNK